MKNLFLIIGLISLFSAVYGFIAKSADSALIISSLVYAMIFLYGYYEKTQGKEMFEE